MRHRIHRDRLRAGERGDCRNRRVLVGRILVHDRDVALAAIRNVNQFFRRIPSQGVNARAVRDRRHDFSRARINDDGSLVATRENPVRRLVIRDSRRPFARRERPRGGRLPRLHVDHLDRALAFVVDEDVSLAIGRGAFGPVVFEFGGADDVAGLGIERGDGADRTAVTREDDSCRRARRT